MDQIARVHELLTTDWKSARANREWLTQTLLDLAGFKTMAEFLQAVAPDTTVVTIVGGAATRWDKSFDDPVGASIASNYGIQRGKSRFLAPVPNLLPKSISQSELIPILTYNLYGIRDTLLDEKGQQLAKHVLIYSKDEEVPDIRAITDAMGISQTMLRKQVVHPGKSKPSGHADALAQHIDEITTTRFVLTQFGCDVSSPITIILSLLCLYVEEKLGESVGLILPTAGMDTPKYPVFIDNYGLPRQFGHEKLLGSDSLHLDSQTLVPGGSNIGVRAYTSTSLREALDNLEETFGQSDEFALDHVDQYLANKGIVRQLCIALPEEISHAAKTLTEIPLFLENEKMILSV